jgi:hypothetical protein
LNPGSAFNLSVQLATFGQRRKSNPQTSAKATSPPEQIRDGWFGGAKIVVVSKLGIQHGQCRLGMSAMVLGNRRLDMNWQEPSLAELNAIAIPDRRKQRIDVPVQPLANGLAGSRIGALEPAERLGQMLDDGCRLQVNAFAVDQNRDLPPTGKRLKFRRLVHPPLEAHITKGERLARQVQHQRDFVRRERMRAAIEREALGHGGLPLRYAFSR